LQAGWVGCLSGVMGTSQAPPTCRGWLLQGERGWVAWVVATRVFGEVPRARRGRRGGVLRLNSKGNKHLNSHPPYLKSTTTAAQVKPPPPKPYYPAPPHTQLSSELVHPPCQQSNILLTSQSSLISLSSTLITQHRILPTPLSTTHIPLLAKPPSASRVELLAPSFTR
jgi:hypothetical protein